MEEAEEAGDGEEGMADEMKGRKPRATRVGCGCPVEIIISAANPAEEGEARAQVVSLSVFRALMDL